MVGDQEEHGNAAEQLPMIIGVPVLEHLGQTTINIEDRRYISYASQDSRDIGIKGAVMVV